MKNLRTLLIISLVLSIVATIVAASLTVTNHSNLKNTFYLIALSMYVLMLILSILNIIKAGFFTGKEKILWILVVVFGNALGVVLYLINSKKDFARN